MADLTVSTPVDNFMQSADAAAMRAVVLASLSASGAYNNADIFLINQSGTWFSTTYGTLAAALVSAAQYQVATNFAALPDPTTNSGVTYLVVNAQGVIWINRKPAGLYTSDGTNWNYDADQTTAYLAGLTPTNGQIPVGNGTNFVTQSVSGDATLAASGALTLATVNSNTGNFGSATQAIVFTVNAKGLITAASVATITPAVGSITGLGTGVGAFLATPSGANLASALTSPLTTGAGGTGSMSGNVMKKIITGTFFMSDGSVITAGEKSFIQCPWAGTITKAWIAETSDTPISGSISLAIWRAVNGSYPPTVSGIISASAPVALSSATVNVNSALTGWTTSISAGDWIGPNVTGTPSSVKRIVWGLEITLT